MKTKDKKKSIAHKIDKSVIQQLQDVRDKVSSEIQDLTYEELLQYLDKKKTLYSTRTAQKQTGNIRE